MMVAIFPTLLASGILAIIIGIPVKMFLSGHMIWLFLSGLAILTIFGVILFFILIIIMERLVPGYKPINSTVALIKNYLNTSKGTITEAFC